MGTLVANGIVVVAHFLHQVLAGIYDGYTPLRTTGAGLQYHPLLIVRPSHTTSCNLRSSEFVELAYLDLRRSEIRLEQPFEPPA